MRKFIYLIIALVICFSTVGTAQAFPITVLLDENELRFDTPPIIENGRTLVPVRAIFEALGANVDWEEETRTVTATKDNVQIKLVIGGQAFKNNQLVNIDVPAKIYNNRTLVPLRFISEAFGASVAWDDYTRTITIKTEPSENYISPEEAIQIVKKTNTIYDDFSQPLSVNWNVGNQHGEWVIDPNNGAYESDEYGFLPLSSNIYIPDKYSIEFEVCSSNWHDAGIFIKSSEDCDYYYWPYTLIFGHGHAGLKVNSYDMQGNHYLDHLTLEEGKYYKVKVNVNDNNVDIYLDGEFLFSDVVSEKSRLGSVVGLYSEGPGGYIKNFKLTI